MQASPPPGNAITYTRVLVPDRRVHVLSRQRLIELFYDLLDYRLIIVSAPAGYGKTTLMIDLAHQIDLPVCWYAIDAPDKDPRRFIAYFIAALSHRFPTFGKSSTAALKNGPSRIDPDQIVVTIVNDLYEHVREHFILVLDDHHLVEENKEIAHFISQFVQHVDVNCHVVLSTRTLPVLPDMPLMVARSVVGGLDLQALAFRADEIQDLLLQNYNLTIPESEARRLAAETEGWITGLLLSAQTMWQGMSDQVRLARASGVGLYDYLAQQVLDQQPAPIREFLLRSSLLEEFDADLCAAVLEPLARFKDWTWQGLIETAVQGNLFILPVDEKGRWVRYHHLFQDFLQRLMDKEHPQETSQILRRLAVVYEEREEWEKAYYRYRQIGDVEATADLIGKAGRSMIAAGRDETLAKWLDALPFEVLTSHPYLLSLRGSAAVDLGEAETGLRFLNQAEADCRVIGDQNCLAHTLVRRAGAHRSLGDYRASLDDIELALDLVKQNTDLRSVQAAAFRVKGVVLRRMGQPHDAIGYLERAEQLNVTLGNHAAVALVQLDLGIALRGVGRYEEAESAYRRSLSYWRETSDLGRQSSTLNNLAVLYHYTRNYEQAAAFLEEAVECARQNGNRRTMAWALTSIGDLYADLEAFDSAKNAYSRAVNLVEDMDDALLRYYLLLSQAALARLRGDMPKAHKHLRKAEKYAQVSKSGYEQNLFHQEAGRLALAEGRNREAVVHFETLTHMRDGVTQPVKAACANLRLASALDAVGNREASAAALARALDFAAGREVWHPLILAAREAYTQLLSVQTDPDIGQRASLLQRYVARYESELPRLRRRLRLRAAAVPIAPPRLVVKALGKGEVHVDRRLITRADWQTWAARDLFFLLLARPEGLTREAIGAILWPESSPARLKLNFKKTIYRLRRALDLDAIRFDNELGRYRFNHHLDYNYDVEEFRAKLAQAKAESNPERVIASIREAIDLYQGPYLPQVDGMWILAEQEELRRTYEESVLKLATLYLDVGEYRETLTCCRLLLNDDPCQEEAHRLAMRAHAALGNRADVRRQFKECKEVLWGELAVEPSPETLALFQTLIHKRSPHLPS